MKKCKTCDFRFDDNDCHGLGNSDLISISCNGGWSGPDGIYVDEEFGCVYHSDYHSKEVRFLHEKCGASFSRAELDSLPDALEGMRDKICSKCGGWIHTEYIEVEK